MATAHARPAGLGPRHPAPVPGGHIRSRWPVHGEDEIAAVTAVLRSGKVNALHHGEQTRAFEQAFAERVQAPHAIAVANGTLALELALRALGIGAGDEVVVPARSFMASASCVAAVGAVPVFADIDPDSQTLTANTIASALSPQTRAIIVVHLAGWPVAMPEIMVLARALGLVVIEDCAQAHGAMHDGFPVGSCSDAAAFSFCTDKIISTGGEGGMLVLHDQAVWERAWAYKDHGKSPHAGAAIGAPGTFRWLHGSLGSNYRSTEMQSAIGLCQLGKLDGWIEARQRNARILNAALAPFAAVRLTLPPSNVRHAYYKYYAFVRPDRLRPGWTRDRIVGECIAAGVPCGTGSCPEIYREQAFVGSPSVPLNPLPVSRNLGETSMMLPVDPTLDNETVERMGAIVASVIERATA
ncbi:DegT/DnrJ/EryC1/StrS aminotransferase family protein [Sphingomonas sp.]|uniref:DegT/DnrJ/EryC1/StrS family aminotransferase n=1 Tax=Sphingomonas sp. TaxID=28214 RepID=UPI002ED93E23